MVEASGSEEEDDEMGVEEYEKEQREKLEQERAAIMNDSTLIAEVTVTNFNIYARCVQYSLLLAIDVKTIVKLNVCAWDKMVLL